METPSSSWTGPAPLASATAGSGQRRVAVVLCLLALVASLALLPIAALPAPAFPGFVLMHQTALIVVLGASAWVLYAQFRRARSLPLLLAASGTLYTTLIVLLQLLSYPGVFGPEPVLGAGSPTTLWFWTFWHLGPPTAALAYALALAAKPAPVPHARIAVAAIAGGLCAVLAAAASLVVATRLLPWLPAQTVGPSYWPMVTSGIGPAVQLLTIAATLVLWRATRGRQSVLELWIAVSLVLLILDNFLTYTGAARGTVGWMAGRGLALISGFAILWAYLIDVDALHGRAEAAAEERARAEAALRQAQKMEAVGQLTGGIAHDFNNLLMVVTSGFDLILRRPDDRARIIKLAEAGLQASERGARLTRQLLSFARRQDLRPELVNPNALLLGSESLLRRALGETVRFDFALDPGLHPTRIDTTEFASAVLNLVVNARDAVQQLGGCVTVTTSNAVLDARTAGRNPEAKPGNYVVVSVADDGVGMDAAALARAFEPFFTTKDVGKGSGLGLSQVYGFTRAAGGFVEMRSTPGVGTTVEMFLPSAVAPSLAAPEVTPAKGGPSLPMRRATNGETVLAVEDEPAVLATVIENLADLGYSVIAANNAVEALERLRGPERIDILFSDVVMPGGMNGVQLAVEAARIRPGLKVLLTSGYTGQALAGENAVPTDLPLLPKPYRSEELASRLRLVMAA